MSSPLMPQSRPVVFMYTRNAQVIYSNKEAEVSSILIKSSRTGNLTFIDLRRVVSYRNDTCKAVVKVEQLCHHCDEELHNGRDEA